MLKWFVKNEKTEAISGPFTSDIDANEWMNEQGENDSYELYAVDEISKIADNPEKINKYKLIITGPSKMPFTKWAEGEQELINCILAARRLNYSIVVTAIY